MFRYTHSLERIVFLIQRAQHAGPSGEGVAAGTAQRWKPRGREAAGLDSVIEDWHENW